MKYNKFIKNNHVLFSVLWHFIKTENRNPRNYLQIPLPFKWLHPLCLWGNICHNSIYGLGCWRNPQVAEQVSSVSLRQACHWGLVRYYGPNFSLFFKKIYFHMVIQIMPEISPPYEIYRLSHTISSWFCFILLQFGFIWSILAFQNRKMQNLMNHATYIALGHNKKQWVNEHR